MGTVERGNMSISPVTGKWDTARNGTDKNNRLYDECVKKLAKYPNCTNANCSSAHCSCYRDRKQELAESKRRLAHLNAVQDAMGAAMISGIERIAADDCAHGRHKMKLTNFKNFKNDIVNAKLGAHVNLLGLIEAGLEASGGHDKDTGEEGQFRVCMRCDYFQRLA